MKFSLLRGACFISLLFTFITIYQHNQIVRLKYAQQRLSKKKENLLVQKNESLVQLCSLTSPEVIKHWAMKEQHMQEFSYSKAYTFTSQQKWVG